MLPCLTKAEWGWVTPQETVLQRHCKTKEKHQHSLILLCVAQRKQENPGHGNASSAAFPSGVKSKPCTEGSWLGHQPARLWPPVPASPPSTEKTQYWNFYFLSVCLRPKAEVLKKSGMLSLSRHNLGETQSLYFHFLHFCLKMLRNAKWFWFVGKYRQHLDMVVIYWQCQSLFQKVVIKLDF